MCKVTVADEDGLNKTILVSNETTIQILKHFNINPETKIVYLNGKILSKKDMLNYLPGSGTVHLVTKNKTVMR